MHPSRATGVAIAIATACAALISLDPLLGTLVPAGWWWRFLRPVPFKFSAIAALLVLGATGAVWLLRRLRGDRLWIAGLFAGAQLTGLKLGIVNVLDVVAASAALVWLTQRLLQPRLPVRLPMLFFFAAGLLLFGIANGVNQNPARTVVGVLALSKVLLLAFMVVQLVHDEATVQRAITAFLAVAVASAAVGVLQIGLYFFAGIQISLLEQFGGEQTDIKDTLVGELMRASALNATAQHLSVYLSLALPFFLFRCSAPAPFRQRAAMLFATLLVLAAIVLTWNNVSLFALPLTLGLFVLMRWPHRLLHIAAAAALALGVLYVTGLVDLLIAHALGERGAVSKGVFQRLALFGWALEKLDRDMLMGVGLRDFSRFSGNYWGRPVHNAYMQAAVDLGVPAMLLFTGMLLTLFTGLMLNLRHAGPREALLYLKPAVLACVTLMFIMMGEPLMDSSNTWLFLATAQGLLTAYRPDRVTRPAQAAVP